MKIGYEKGFVFEKLISIFLLHLVAGCLILKIFFRFFMNYNQKRTTLKLLSTTHCDSPCSFQLLPLFVHEHNYIKRSISRKFSIALPILFFVLFFCLTQLSHLPKNINRSGRIQHEKSCEEFKFLFAVAQKPQSHQNWFETCKKETLLRVTIKKSRTAQFQQRH